MRYIILVLANLPIILLALVNIVTQYKMKRISSARFRHQVLLWLLILAVLVGSFPMYNYLNGNAPLDSHELSAFDIVETTAIVYLMYIVNNHRRKLEQTEKTMRELHQEISITLSSKSNR
jgi:uncharacterized membrane protein